MNILKKTLAIFIVSIILSHCIENNVCAAPPINTKTPINVGVFFHNSYDPFLLDVKKNLEDIQKENESKIKFTFFDAKDNQLTQNESIDQAINKKFNLLIINLATTNKSSIEGIIQRIIQKNIPFIIYVSSTSEITNYVKNSSRAVVIGGHSKDDGLLQGKILADAWNANKEIWDKNHDNIMQYVILKGPADSPATIERTKYSILAINNSGIETQELSSVVCGWEEECARTAMESIFLGNGDKIEAIIANNDAMAIGAIKTLQKYGYNKGETSKYIPVIGFDGLPEAKELIKQGFMTGTVVQDSSENAKAIYAIGMNLVSGSPPLNGTNYKFDETGIQIKIPVYEYVK